jgi:cytochrome c551/c552
VTLLRRLGIVAVLALVGAQAYRPERTNPPVTGDVDAPADVRAVLRRACYDCHSHETVWPWYARVAPASWLLAHDVDEGRDELDFSTWDAYPPARKAKKLGETAKEVDEGEMPPWYYVVMHAPARLDAADKQTLRVWAATEQARLTHGTVPER